MKRTLVELKAMAQERVLEIVGALGIAIPRSRGTNYISLSNPVVKDKTPSFCIWTSGPAAGAWKDFRGIAQGDIIDLIAYVRGWSSGNDKQGRRQAMLWLAEHFGCELTSRETQQARAGRQVKAQEAQQQGESTLEQQRERAREIFIKAKPIIDTPVWTYLKQARKIDLELLPRGPRGGWRLPGTIRYLANARHSESNQYFPAMLAGCVSLAGKIEAIHRTFLAYDGSDKAPVRPQKKVWPTYKGLIIPIWRGAGNRTLGQAIEEHEKYGVFESLVLTEGIEDALTAAIDAPQLRVWAFITIGNLASLTLPPCFDTVLLHRQYEPLNPVATAAFNKGLAALRRQGAEIVEIHPRRGKDLNDTRRAAHERESRRREHHRTGHETAEGEAPAGQEAGRSRSEDTEERSAAGKVDT